MDDSGIDPWSISVKTVGGSSAEESFQVRVSPNDSLTTLHHEIQTATGLAPRQQKLIYRGRLLPNHSKQEQQRQQQQHTNAKNAPDELAAAEVPSGGSSDPTKIKDIPGLQDGQTIHLVKRREAEPKPHETSSPSATAATTTTTAASVVTPDSARSRFGRRAAENGLNAQRLRPPYRLSRDDLRAPEPGSMEPVRQSLMTLHTILPATAQQQQTETTAAPPATERPWDCRRQWYRGQWIDCRDTVNQWLEATIVDVVDPEEILPSRRNSSPDEPTSSAPETATAGPATDTVVFAADLDERRNLLLTPCDPDDERSEEGELRGFRRRTRNVQLLLVHYNGWPHRWDEWIRSDSERIRPFRTRTRHTNGNIASPMPQTLLHSAPSTFLRDGGHSDRRALLPELGRVLSEVNELVAQAADVSAAPPSSGNAEDGNMGMDTHLPWQSTATPASQRAGHTSISPNPAAESAAQDDARQTRQQLQALAPLLDRLGRTLMDAAPHVAYLAQEDEPQQDPIRSPNENSSSLGGLLSLLNRDRRRQSIGSVGTNTDSRSSSTTTNNNTEVDADYVDFATGVVNTTRGEVRAGPRSRQDELTGLLGAYLAAASLTGLVGGSETDDGGLGRLFRDRGTGDGIDIHIHAVVTSPGGDGAVGSRGGAIPVTASPVVERPFMTGMRATSASTRRAAAVVEDRSSSAHEEDDDGIFGELYSETPDPIDLAARNPRLHRSTQEANNGETSSFLSTSSSSSRQAQRRESRRRNPLSRLFRRR